MTEENPEKNFQMSRYGRTANHIREGMEVSTGSLLDYNIKMG